MTTIRLGRGAEFDLIRSFLADAHSDVAGAASVRIGPGDDCAVISDGVAFSIDMSVEDVHFRRTWLTPEEIGYRATAAALSDLAAVAATPIGVLVSLAIPAAEAGALAPRVMHGCRDAAAAAGAVLLGGDFTRSPDRIVIDVAVAGTAPAPVLRSGARDGDAVWVTGALGGAAAAVRAWRRREPPAAGARERFARPQPRIREARWLASRAAVTALIDISDGLAGDAGHIAAASGVRITLDAAAIPIDAAVRSIADDDAGALRLALAGGEDYEVCVTAPAGAVEAVHDEFVQAFGVQLTRVGTVAAGEGVMIRTPDGRVAPLPYRGHDHLEDGTS